MAKKSKYDWTYCSLGGVTRVKISNGEDIAHLDELDQKLWTVLSCPTSGLMLDSETLKMIDTDGDGKIRVPEIISAAQWLTSVIKDKDLILKGDSVLPLNQFNTENEEGKKLHNSAVRILRNLCLDKQEISLEDTSDFKAIFASSQSNGDGIITVDSSDNEAIRNTIRNIIDTLGSVQDRSGETGIDKGKVDAFYAACDEFADWQKESKANPALLPYGENTAAALAACEELSSKIKDFFIRCHLIGYNGAYSDSVVVPADKVSAISDKNLAECADEIATYPIASPSVDCILPYKGINPAWQVAFNRLRTLVLDIDFADRDGITEDEWNAILSKFEPYKAWLSAKKGAEVESLGIDRIQEIIREDLHAALLEIIEKDLACAEEVNSINEVHKLLHLYRDFYKLLRNYITFTDLYSTKAKDVAIFEAGHLYIDQRCCKLCVKVENMGAHGDMAALSGIFLIYCHCVCRTQNKEMDIVAIMTNGNTRALRPGKNGIFYDLSGQDWDATITKIVDNPISIEQAFWAPYRKFWEFCVGLINKSAAEKESKAIEGLKSTATATAADPEAAKKATPFDIAKFAGIFAALGMAIGYIGSFCTKIIGGVTSTPLWKTAVILLCIMACISGPSCFIAWSKLRKRNLGPVLNANGWAINSVVLINIIFGKTLTSIAKYPIVKGAKDPFKKDCTKAKVISWIVAVLIVAIGGFFLARHLLSKDAEEPAKTEQTCEVPVTEAAVEAEEICEPSAE